MNNPQTDWTATPPDGIKLAKRPFDCDVSIEDASKIKTRTIKLRAEPKNNTHWCGLAVEKVISVDLGGDGCSAGSCSMPGDGTSSNGCVNVAISLGRDNVGASAGYIYLLKDLPTAPLAANQLTYHVSSRTPVVEFTRGTMSIKQIKVPGALVEVVAGDPNAGPFTVDFYTNASAGTPTGGIYSPSSDPYRRWKFEDPDGDGPIHVRVNDNYKQPEEYGQSEVAVVSDYTYQATAPAGWVMQQWDRNHSVLLRTITHVTNEDEKTYEVTGAQGTVEKTEKVHDAYGNVTQLTAYADAGAPVVTNYVRTADGLLRQTVEESSGRWEMIQYDTSGRKVRTVSSYLSAAKPDLPPLPTDDIDDSTGHAFVYDYTTSLPGDTPTFNPQEPRIVTEKINGTIVSKTYQTYHYDHDDNVVAVVLERDSNPGETPRFGESGNLRTTTWLFRFDDPVSYQAGKPYRVYHPDGTMEEYEYAKGGYTLHPDHIPSDLIGSGDFIKTTVRHGWGAVGSSLFQEPGKSTTSVTITDPTGRVIQDETKVWNGSADEQVAWSVREYDDQGRLTGVYRHNGANETTSYDTGTCCGNWITTGPDGVKTSYALDSLRRVYQKVKNGVVEASDGGHTYDAQSAVTTTYGYDAVGRLLSTTVTAGTLTQSTSTTYDWLGRPKLSTDPAGIHTSYHYGYPDTGGGRIDTVRRFVQNPADPYASGVPEVTEYYPDGRLKSVSGAGVVERHYTYDVETLGVKMVINGTDQTQNVPCRTTTVRTGPPPAQGPDNRPWTKTWTDPLGRTVREDRPAYPTEDGPTALATFSIYNEKGQLVRSEHRYVTGTQVGGKFLANTIYVYDELGSQTASGQDLDTTPGLQPGGTDRYQETEAGYTKIGDDWWQQSRAYTFATDGSAARTWLGTNQQRLTGLAKSQTEWVSSEAESYDIHNNKIISKIVHTKLTDDTIVVKQVTDVPDSQYDRVSVSRNGLLQYTTSTSNLKTTYKYDALGRRTHVKEARHSNPTVTAYDPDTGQVTTVTDPAGNVTSYDYYPYTGRLKSVTRAYGTALAATQYFAYDDQGRQTHVWGNGTYPVQYEYDAYGHRTKMHTFRSPSGIDFTGSTWPSISIPDPPQANDNIETTTWTYDPVTGLLISKTDDSNKSVVYTYTPDGKLHTRQWARHDANTVTTYTYDPDTGEMTGIDYPGTETPDVTFTYTRLGRQYQITDGVGTRTFDYDDGETGEGNTLRVVSEAIAGTGGFYSKTITRDYQGNTAEGELAGRDAGFHIGSDYAVTYRYDNQGTGSGLTGTGRFKRITGPGLPTYGVEYGRPADSELIEYARYKTDVDTTLVSTQRDYESNRDLIEWVENKVGDTVVSRYDYNATGDDLDALGRRTSVVYTGTAFAQSHLFKWGYNPRSELTTADRHQGTNPDAPGDQYTQYGDYEFAYDHIGNRQTYGLDANPDTAYTANDLNQYDSTTNPTEVFDYDDDGNLTQDGTFTYAWDAENRLVEVVPVSPSNDPPRNKKVKFVYDYMGRRVQKAVYVYNNGWPADDDPDERWHFVYDGWNVVMMLDGMDGPDPGTEPDNTIVRKYTWGLDLSGTIHGAGGIGGLLACVETQGTTGEEDDQRYWFFYDANGNIGQVIKASDLSVAARYEYDPYGNVIGPDPNNNGNWQEHATAFALANPIRFSTKWFDPETGLGNWTFRYYSPRLGRWISRDPMGEKGGEHLYSFVSNRAGNAVDPDGRFMIAWKLAASWPCALKAFRAARQEKDTIGKEEDWAANGFKMWHCVQACRFLHECWPCPEDNWLKKAAWKYKRTDQACKVVWVFGISYEVCTAIGIGDPSFDGQTPDSWLIDTPGDMVANIMGVYAWVISSEGNGCVAACKKLGAHKIKGPRDIAPPPATE